MTEDEKPKPPRGRPFQKGESGNPSGRPKGARNRMTAIAESLLEGDAESIIRKIIDDAKAEDRPARRFLASRLLPVQRERPVQLEIPELRSAADAVTIYVAIVNAIAAGEMTPSQGCQMKTIIEGFFEASSAERASRPFNWDEVVSNFWGTPPNQSSSGEPDG